MNRPQKPDVVRHQLEPPQPACEDFLSWVTDGARAQRQAGDNFWRPILTQIQWRLGGDDLDTLDAQGMELGLRRVSHLAAIEPLRENCGPPHLGRNCGGNI